MNKLLIGCLSIMSISVSATPILATEYSQIFKNYRGCFILYSISEHQIISKYNPNNYCNERISPDSTFKIAISLMAFNQGIINQGSVFKWDGKKRELPDWNQDQSPHTWLKYSALWVSQAITPQLGIPRMKHYLAGFYYGNQDFSGDPGQNNGISYAWVASSLKISAVEQLNFLNAMLKHELPVDDGAINNTKQNLYQGKLINGASYYGKTGSGRHGRSERELNPSKLHDGWFVGFVESGSKEYTFVTNISDNKFPVTPDKSYGRDLAKPIAIKLLNEYFTQ